MPVQFDLQAVPPLGTQLKLDGQRYELETVTPYVRKRDGAQSALLTWRSDCPECHSSFTTQSGLKCSGLIRRCDRCKDALTPVGRHGRRIHVEILYPEPAVDPQSLY